MSYTVGKLRKREDCLLYLLGIQKQQLRMKIKTNKAILLGFVNLFLHAGT